MQRVALRSGGLLNDMATLNNALFNSGILAHFEHDVAQAERSASEVIELSTCHNLPFWLAIGSILRGWVLSISGEPGEGVSWIEQGIKDYRAPGSTLGLPYFLGLKAEALFAANRSSEALQAVEEATAVAQKCEARSWSAELQRLRAVLLAAIGAEEAQIEVSFREAISIAKKQKSISRQKRRSNLRGISQTKSQCVRRTWVPTTSLVTHRIQGGSPVGSSPRRRCSQPDPDTPKPRRSEAPRR